MRAPRLVGTDKKRASRRGMPRAWPCLYEVGFQASVIIIVRDARGITGCGGGSGGAGYSVCHGLRWAFARGRWHAQDGVALVVCVMRWAVFLLWRASNASKNFCATFPADLKIVSGERLSEGFPCGLTRGTGRNSRGGQIGALAGWSHPFSRSARDGIAGFDWRRRAAE